MSYNIHPVYFKINVMWYESQHLLLEYASSQWDQWHFHTHKLAPNSAQQTFASLDFMQGDRLVGLHFDHLTRIMVPTSVSHHKKYVRPSVVWDFRSVDL